MNSTREYPERPVLGVGGVVISDGRVLLARRGEAPLLGQWSIPGGMLETGETIVAGVRRELLEETGIEVQVHELIEVFERISLDTQGRAEFHYVVLDYFCEPLHGNARAGSDAVEIDWVAESDLNAYALTEAAERIIRRAFELSRKKRQPV